MVIELFVGAGLGYGFRGLINRTGKKIVEFVKTTVEPRVAAVENRAIALEAKIGPAIASEVSSLEKRIIAAGLTGLTSK